MIKMYMMSSIFQILILMINLINSQLLIKFNLKEMQTNQEKNLIKKINGLTQIIQRNHQMDKDKTITITMDKDCLL